MNRIAKTCVEIGLIKELFEEKLISEEEFNLAMQELKKEV